MKQGHRKVVGNHQGITWWTPEKPSHTVCMIKQEESHRHEVVHTNTLRGSRGAPPHQDECIVWMCLRSPLVEEIKRQMLLPWELLSQCSSTITMYKVSTREQLFDLMSKREVGGKHKGRTMLLHLSGFTSSFFTGEMLNKGTSLN